MNKLVTISTADAVPARALSETIPDPVFEVIEAHRVASAAYDKAVNHPAVGDDSHPDGKQATRISNRTMQTLFRQANRLFKFSPTTASGLVAMLQYISSLNDWEMPGHFSEPREIKGLKALCSAMAAGLKRDGDLSSDDGASAVTTSAASFPELVAPFLALRARWRDEAWKDKAPEPELDDVHERLMRIGTAMVNQPPKSLRDLGWQAEAILTWADDLETIVDSDDAAARMLKTLLANIRSLAAPLSIPLSAVEPDAELLGWIDQLWALVPRYWQIQAQYDAEQERWFKRRPSNDAEPDAAMTAVEIPYDQLLDEMIELERKIFSTRARTLAGVKAKAHWHLQFHCDGDVSQLIDVHGHLESLFLELGGADPDGTSELDPRMIAHPDALLLDLADQFDNAMNEYEQVEAVWLELDDHRVRGSKELPRGYNTAQIKLDRKGRACEKLEEKILGTPAKTVDGIIAKARALSRDLVDGESAEEGKHVDYAVSMCRDLLALGGADRGVKSRSLPDVDPIFAAIEAHRNAYAAVVAGRVGLDDEAFTALSAKESAAAERIAETVPSTLEGLFALLDYLQLAIKQQEDSFGLVFGNSTAIFTSLAKAANALSGRAPNRRGAQDEGSN